jgi:predicted TIM-barrel fold metal-dependent hydrolase
VALRAIAIEEHYAPAAFTAVMESGPGAPWAGHWPEALVRKLTSVGAERLADMDAAGIDVQVLSVPAFGFDRVTPATAVAATREINDALAAAARAYPGRFAGLALLPLQDPAAAAAELERSVSRLGLKGVMISGTTNGRFLDDPAFEPVLATAERLDVPIYLHPAPPPPEVYQAYYGGLPDALAWSLCTSAWGWHVETGLHTLRLIVGGVFDRFPRLQVIIGHMGENLPFSLARASERLTPVAPQLQRPLADYFHANVAITISGYFTEPPLLCALQVVGADHILFAVDYPFASNAVAKTFLEHASLSPTDREKIAHGNAERMLKL